MSMEDPEEEIILFDQGWTKIETIGIEPFLKRVECFDTDELDTKPNPMQEFLSTYDTVFQMCIQREPYNYSDRLYSNYGDSFTKYFKEYHMPSLKRAKGKSGLEFLNEFARRWQQNQYAVLGMQRMFCYLDRFFVPNNEELKGMKEQGYSLYKDHVFDEYKDDARVGILKCIRAERDGNEQNRDLLRNCVHVFCDLGGELTNIDLNLYKDHFQDSLIKQSIEYYKVQSEKWLNSTSCPEYLIRAEEVIENEKGRIKSYLHSSTEKLLMHKIRHEILVHHQEALLQSPTGIVNMLEEHKSEDLSRLYKLYSEVEPDSALSEEDPAAQGGNIKGEAGLTPVANEMHDYIVKLGKQYIKESKEQQRHKGKRFKHKLIQNLIKLHDRFLKVVKNEFGHHRLFNKAMKEAFEQFINEEYYTSNFLAKYVNDFLRKGGIGINFKDDKLDQQMIHIVMLYSYIRDKDIFENNYQNYLSNRLLTNASASEQNEKKMIGKLKQESGRHWTQRLEDMFSDIQRSKTLMKQFKRGVGQSLPVDLNIAVCTQGAWPAAEVPTIKSPFQLDELIFRFRQFYEEKHVGRRLNFLWDKGTAEVALRFNPKCEKILVVSTYQMVVLFLFETTKQVLTWQQIMDKTGIVQADLANAVLGLAHPKTKILLKKPSTVSLQPDHQFRINFRYKNPQARIFIPILKTARQINQEDQDSQKAVLSQRKHQVDAACVRVMKARKMLAHQVLVSEIRNQIKQFDVQPQLIKQRIEALINLDYLERDADNRSMYHYKASAATNAS